MKKHLLFFTIFLFCSVFGQDHIQKVQALLDKVTVYSYNCTIHQSFNSNLPKGESYILVGNIANNIDFAELNLIPDKNVKILSLSNYNNSNSDIRKLIESTFDKKEENDSTDYYENLIYDVNKELSIINNSIDILKKNQNVQNASNKEEITSMIDFNVKKLEQFLDEKEDFEDRKNIYEARKQTINRRNNENRQINYNQYILVKLLSDKSQKVNFTANYKSNNARWSPHYEIKATSIQKPLKIHYKANIQQSTGIDWKDTKIYLVYGNVDEDQRPYGISRWNLRTARRETEEINNQAFKSQYQESNSKAMMVAEVSHGSVQKKMISSQIELDKNTFIPSNNLNNFELISTFEVDTEYKFYTAPKVQKEAFLLAYLKNYSKYNLLTGSADIFVDDVKVGRTQIDSNQLTENLLISLGKDNDMAVNRSLSSQKSEQIDDKSRKETYYFELTIKNNKNESINMEIKDQIPVSNDEKIVIKLVEPNGAEHEQYNGILTWNIQLKPNEIKKIKYGFTVTLPKELITKDIY